MAHPEASLQRAVVQYLELCLSPHILWTASLTGTALTPPARGRAKAAGVRPGWPDLAFLLPNGITVYIELKAPRGHLLPEQRTFRDAAEPNGIWAVCRSVDDVARALDEWGVQLRGQLVA